MTNGSSLDKLDRIFCASVTCWEIPEHPANIVITDNSP